MRLREWHDSLDSHFAGLCKQRAKDNCPVFVFEHGLNSGEREGLKLAVHEHLETSTPDARYWLPWIVYATEIGYEFDGHNFWSPFQEKTSNWTNYDRPFIRDSFKKFVKSFGGFEPSDIWANKFNIICYPITHAILPRDLQSHLARILRDLRFQFKPSLLQSTEQLGAKILSRSDGTSKRFQLFSQNIELTGSIARGLLSHDEEESGNIISPSALERIVGDLRQQRDAASWLDEARTFARNRTSKTARVRTEGDKSQRIKLEPRLMLRPVTATNWDLFVEFPDLQPLAEQSNELSEFLTSSRPLLNGSFYDKRLARGSLVSYGVIREKLKTLPDETQDLLVFRREKPSALDKFLKDEFRLRAQHTNLFKVHSDGLAYKQKSLSVCPGNRYLILSRNTVPINSLVAKQTVSCDDLHLYLLSLPKTISSKEESFLSALGFKIKLGIDMTPVGTPPAAWDEETYIEFLADEDPCLAISLDHEVESLRLEYGDEKLEISSPAVVNPILINLPQFPIGSYKLAVSEKSYNQNRYEILASVEINIREPRSQQSATTTQNVLLLFTDPYRPAFEQLFAGEVKFDFWTPPDTIVDVYLTLFRKRDDDNQLLKKKLFSCSLPDDVSKLNANILDALQDSQILGKSEDAYSCLLEFEAGELGTVPVNFERELLPLKWNVKADKNQVFLRLSDYSDSAEKISVVKYDFLTPDQKIIVPYDETHELGFPIPSSGGLYIAENSQIKQAIIVLRQLERSSFRSFADLRQEDGFTPKFLKYKRTAASLLELLGLYITWAASVSAGSVIRKTDINVVLNGLLLEIVSLVDDGFIWRKAEVLFCADKNKDSLYLHKAVSSKPSLTAKLAGIFAEPRFLSADVWVDNLVFALGDEVPEERTKIQKVGRMSHIKVTSRNWFAEFALRLCSHPETLQTWADKRYELGLAKMLAHPTLVRAARYIILTTNRKTSNGDRNLPYTWDWE